MQSPNYEGQAERSTTYFLHTTHVQHTQKKITQYVATILLNT